MWTKGLDGDLVRNFPLLITIIIWKPQRHQKSTNQNKHHKQKQITHYIQWNKDRTYTNILPLQTRQTTFNLSNSFWGIVIWQIIIYLKSGEFNF